MGYIELTKNDLQVEKELIEIYSRMVSRLPEGRLTMKMRGGGTYYYRTGGGSAKQEYISVKDRDLIEALRDRRYAEKMLKVLRENIRVQERMLRSYRSYSPEHITSTLGKAYQSLGTPPGKPAVARRKSSDADSGTAGALFRSDELLHRTSFGLMVRSKSEALIAELLRKHRIDFSYEKPLRLVDDDGFSVVKYPDFTVRSRGSGVMYWEHLGLLTDADYREAAYRKLGLYYDNGIIPGSNLIITCDSADGGLDMSAISKIAASLA